MLRREFLPLLALPLWGRPALKITDVEIWKLEGKRQTEAGVNRQHQIQPIHLYEERRPPVYKDNPQGTAPANLTAYYLKIIAGDVSGIYGPIDKEAIIVVDQQLKNFLIGKDALAGETLWDQMYRLNRHSRAGHFMMAISAVDNALWDLRGHALNAPVYQLLGGPTRAKIAVYGSCLGYSLELDKVQERTKELRDSGFQHQKWFLAYGPGHGPEGLLKNVELVRTLRESAGDGVDLMFDAFMGWDLNYALAWAKQVEQYRPRWIEEAFPMDKLESFIALRRATSIPVATGEHVYGRWEAKRFMESGAIQVMQADPEWCGGVSELAKICNIASSFDVQVIPHGHNVHAALHVVASQSPMTCPLVEFLILKMVNYYHFDKNPIRVKDGHIQLNDKPGFGIELDDSKIEKKTLMKFS